jgi:hypothetical protein
MSKEEELKRLLVAKEEEASLKELDLINMKTQMTLMMETMQKQQEAMVQLQNQLKGSGSSVVGATTVVTTKEKEKEDRREEAKTIEVLKQAVPILEWGGKNFELWEEKVRLVLMTGKWRDIGKALEGVGTEEVTTVVKTEGKKASPASTKLPGGGD